MIVEKEIDRILTLLRNKIREQNFTQLEVQDALGWGRSYISQLLTKQKSLRVEQVLRVLAVIGISPVQFFAELYHFPEGEFSPRAEVQNAAARAVDDSVLAQLQEGLEEQRELVRSLVRLLVAKKVITLEELTGSLQLSSEDRAQP
jgi:transcriptional regulator with XRE-family HTH domain